MRTAQIKQKLHDYIESTDEKTLKAIYTLLENDIDDDSLLTADQKKEVDRRYDDYVNGIGKTFSWDETVTMARQTLADRKAQK